MTVYIDNSFRRSNAMVVCYMMADTTDELHAMAIKIGLPDYAFELNTAPHYNVCKSKRALALRYGARPANRLKMVELIRSQRPMHSGYAGQKVNNTRFPT